MGSEREKVKAFGCGGGGVDTKGKRSQSGGRERFAESVAL